MLPLKVTFLTRLTFYQMLTSAIPYFNRNLALFLNFKTPYSQLYHVTRSASHNIATYFQNSHSRRFFACYCNLPTSAREEFHQAAKIPTAHRRFFALTSKPIYWARLDFLRSAALFPETHGHLIIAVLFWITSRPSRKSRRRWLVQCF